MSLPSVQVGLQTLRANPVRTLLSTLGIVMGAASLVGVLSVGDGAQRFARRQIEQFGLQAIAVVPKTSDTVDGLAIPRRDFPVFTIGQEQSLAARLGAASPVVLSSTGTGTFVLGGAPRAAPITGVYGSLEALFPSGVANGRFFTEEEMRGTGALVVVSHNLARLLAGDRSVANALNAHLLMQGRAWTVVGVLAERPNERTFNVLVPIGSLPLAAVPETTARPPSLLVQASRIEDVLHVKSQIEEWADATNASWRKGSRIAVTSQGVERLRQLNQAMLMFKLLMGSFAAISLVVGGIGIMNVLLAAVAERTREIGVRKATGATRGDIVAQFLSESVTISVAGAVLGAAVGLAGATAITAFIRWRASAPLYAAFTWQSFAVSMSAAIAVGLVFGVYPALKAGRLSPVDAMRYE